MGISAVLITYNEELNIEACLQTVQWADELVIVDSGSIDRTLPRAQRFNAKIFHRPFTNFSEQKNDALSHATQDWVFLIDADERMPSELAREVQKIVAGQNADAVYAVPRETYFFNHRLRFSGTRGDFPIRLFPRDKARFEQPVHEIVVSNLPQKRLRHALYHYSTRDLKHYKEKLQRYIPLELETMARKGRRPAIFDPVLRPLAQFIWLYFFQLGILDGMTGLNFAFLSAYYTFLKYTKALAESQKRTAHESQPIS